MTRDLEGRVALVTGGGRGIGLAIARALAGRGAAVVVADNGTSIDGRGTDATVAQAAAAEIGGHAFSGSVADAEGARAAVGAAVERFGALDIVVDNAAILRDGFVFKSRPDDFDAVVRTNLSAAWYVLAAATPLLRDQAKAGRAPGRIVNIVSTAGLYGNYGQGAYAAAKAGLVGLTRAVAFDMRRAGVCCNAVAPFAATRVTETIQPADAAQDAYKQRALRVPAAPVGDFVAWLCGPLAADVTGQVFGVRGRQVFLFSQPRPVAEFVAVAGDDAAGFDQRLRAALSPRFTDMATDLEAFADEPVL